MNTEVEISKEELQKRAEQSLEFSNALKGILTSITSALDKVPLALNEKGKLAVKVPLAIAGEYIAGELAAVSASLAAYAGQDELVEHFVAEMKTSAENIKLFTKNKVN